MTKKKVIIISSIVLVLCVIATIGGIVFFKKTPAGIDYKTAAALYPEDRMLEFDETYYFHGDEDIDEDMVTGTQWRVNYNGHVTAFKFHLEGGYFDYADFDLSAEETQKLWEYADSLEGYNVPDEYKGYAYGWVLYKYNEKGEKSMEVFSGLSSDYPSGNEIYNILSTHYKEALENQEK